MDPIQEKSETPTTPTPGTTEVSADGKIKTRSGSGYLKQLYSTARATAGTTHSNFKNLTTFLVNFIPVDKIDASELQVRTHFEDSEIEGLAHSIKEHGVLQPILVVQDGDRYKVIAGERRLRASKLAGIERIPARVLSTNDRATHEIALRENLDRVDLHPIEEGEGYVSLLEANLYASHDAIAKGFSKPKSRITECIGFTKLPDMTKGALLKSGLKSRSLLRRLLNEPVENHEELIREAAKLEQKELVLDILPIEKKLAQKNKEKPETEKKVFEFQSNPKGLVVPGFRWKPGSGKDVLTEYRKALTQLIQEVDRILK